MSDREQPTSVYDDPDLEWGYDDDALPPRPRRRLLTPVSGGLAAIVLLAGGFVGGVQVQKHQGDGSASGAGASGARAGFAARLGQGGGAATGAGQAAGGAAATVGTVANVKGSFLYVTGTDGTTVKVKTNDNSKVTRNASASVKSVHPGDTVVVQGAKAAGGTVTASSITATAKGVSAFGGLPGAAGGGTSSGVPQGFAPPAG
jgi:hypothetical protein